MRVRLHTALACAAGAAWLAACERVEPRSPAPAAEFIIAAADSSYWVRSDPDGIRVRGAPLTLASVDGRFAELYLADVDQSFYDAVYIGQRLIKRDIVSGDSVLLFADTLMPVLARAYAAANPEERPLSADEEGNENPRTIATAEVIVLDVHGPWLSYEYRTDVDVVGGVSAHGSRRGVIDLRTGTPVTLEAVLGVAEARRVIAEGRARWRGVRDSLAAGVAERGTEAADELERLAFDPLSFTIGVRDREPVIRFSITQSAGLNIGGSYELPGIAIPEPDWWTSVRRGLAIEESPDERAWPGEGFTLVAQDTARGLARVAFALRDDAGSEWRLGSVPAPVHRVMWLGDTIPAGTRAALTRAFNESAFQGGELHVVRAPAPVPAPRVAFTAARLP